MTTAFCGLLRIGAALNLRCKDVILSWVPGFAQAVLLLGTTKRGAEEPVVLTNPVILDYPKRFYLWGGAQFDPEGRFILSHIGESGD